MTDHKSFTNLLFSQKHLWVEYQTVRWLRDHPEDDPESVHGRFVDAASGIYHPLEEILLERLPTQDELETILLAADLAMAEGKVF